MFSKRSSIAGVSESLKQLTTTSEFNASAAMQSSLDDRLSTQFQFNNRASDISSIGNRAMNGLDQAGNTPLTARDITVSRTEPRIYTDSVGANDPNDYYRFTLTRQRMFNLAVTGLTADADVELYNASGVLMNRSIREGTSDESINMELGAGTYYIRVFPYNGSTNYTLQVSQETAGPVHTPSALLVTEGNLGVLSNSLTSLQGSINSLNMADTYRFSLASTSTIDATLTGLTGDLGFRLIRDTNNNGLLETGEEVVRSQRVGTVDELINAGPLTAGSYFLQVYQFTSGSNYAINLMATPFTLSTPPSNLLATEVNAGVLNSTQVYTDSLSSTDTSDLYNFRLTATSNFNASLNVLAGDMNMRLIQDVNGNGIVDSGDEILRSQRPGTQNDAINVAALGAGNYFLQVYQQSGRGGYTLRMSGLAAETATTAGTPSNLLPVEQNVVFGNVPITYTGAIGNTNTADVYSFRLDQVSRFNAILGGMTADLDIRLVRDFNNNGVIDAGEELMRSQLNGTAADMLSRDLGPGNYLVQVYQAVGSSNYTLQMSGTPVVRPFDSTYGYGLVDAAAAFALARGMASIPDVTNLGGNDWGVDMVRSPEVWAQGFTGQNVVVAVLDSGVDYNHVDLNDNIWVNSREIADNGIDDDGNGFIDDVRGWDFAGRDNDPMDMNSHGTHVAGTIAAERNDFGMTGVAPNARIMPVRVLGEMGYGEDTDIIAGIYYAVNNGAHVINMSLGGGDFSQAMADAIAYAHNRGVVVVMAAGNSALSAPEFPAQVALNYGIAVGAVDNTNKMASFSNLAGNNRMDYVVAPGMNVYSTTPGNTYDSYNGTSMAAPHVAGVAALLRSAFPTLTAAQIENILTASANPHGITV